MYRDNNFVRIEGFMGGDPELRESKSCRKYTFFSVAVSRPGKQDENGNWSHETDWISCTAFGATAEYMAKNIKKGDLVAVSGSLSVSQTDGGAEGVKEYRTNVVVDTVARKAKSGQTDGNANANKSVKATAKVSAPVNTPVADDSDELPF